MRVIDCAGVLIISFILVAPPAGAQLFSLHSVNYLVAPADTCGRGIALDGDGNIYVTGFTRSPGFPTRGEIQSPISGEVDTFVVKLSSSGSELIYATYLGGSGTDQAHGIAVDSQGRAVVAGVTSSSDFPTRNAYQSVLAGGKDAFVSMIDPAGSALVWSSYLGGSGDDAAFGLALDPEGNVYLAGETISADFPTRQAYQASKAGWEQDLFAVKMTPSGSDIIYSTYLGGTGVDTGGRAALGGDRSLYLTGATWSDDFPTRNCYSPARSGRYDAVVVRLAPAGDDLIYSTYLGGAGSDFGRDIAVGNNGSAYVTGYTLGQGFPEVNPLYRREDSEEEDEGTGFLSRISPAGSELLFSTCWPAKGGVQALAVALDPAGYVYVAGQTGAINFPLRQPFQPLKSGRADCFLVKVDATLPAVIYSTYLGGLDTEKPYGLAVDTRGRAYITGYTDSKDFPIRAAVQPTLEADSAAFVAGMAACGSDLLFSTFFEGKR